MKTFYIVISLFYALQVMAQEKKSESEYNTLNEFEQFVILNKGTEPPFTGAFYKHDKNGIYICKQCDAPLYRSADKFDSHCGWPGFEDEIEGAIKKIMDADGRRIEIICANCGGHLGHIFYGEGFTAKNTRHCVNSVSLNFIPAESDSLIPRHYFVK